MRVSRVQAWVGLAAALAIAASAVPWTVNTKKIAARMNAALPTGEGLHWERPKSASFALFPRPVLDIAGVRLVDAGGREVLTASAAALALSAGQLLIGNFEVVEARLRDPAAVVDLDALATRLPTLTTAFKPPLRRLIAKGGRLRLVSKKRGLSEDFGPFDGALTWPKVAEPLRFSVHGVWREQLLVATGGLATPAALIAGGASDGDLVVSTDGADFQYRGKLTRGAKPSAVGDLTLGVRSPRAAAAKLGLAFADALPIFAIEMTGRVAAGPDALTLANASMTLAGQSFEGTASLSRSGDALAASATLAADQIDLDPLLGPPPPFMDRSTGWSRRPWMPPIDPKLDLDFRLSANHASWGSLAVDGAAVALTRLDGDASLKILEATLADGALTGELRRKACTSRCSVHASLTLANADLNAAMRPFGVAALSGHGALKLDLAADGDTPAEIVGSARGEVDLTAENGAIAGVSFEEALRRGQRRAIDLSRDLADGQTAFTAARAKLMVAGGTAEIADARLAGPGAIVVGAGAIDLTDCAWNARLMATQAGALGTPSPDAARLTLSVSGPWLAPSYAVTTPAD